MTNALTNNIAECEHGSRQIAYNVTYKEALDFCGENGLRSHFEPFPCDQRKTIWNPTFWTGLKRYNFTHFTDGVNVTKIGSLNSLFKCTTQN